MSAGALLPPSASPPTRTAGLGWVAAELDLRVDLDGGVPLTAFDQLAGLALRRNPRRAHLLVSRVLGKHLPVSPSVALSAAGELAARARAALPGGPPGGALVLGFAETATALGQAVAAALKAGGPGEGVLDVDCALSTRRPGTPSIVFAEEHSHAVAHRVLAPAAMLDQPRPVILVDDELSSGRTAVNTIRALHQRSDHPAYIVAALLDLRPPAARSEFERLAAELGVPVTAVSLLSGGLQVAPDAVDRVAHLVAVASPLDPEPRWAAARIDADWPASVRLSARGGWNADDEKRLAVALEPLAEQLAAVIATGSGRRVLVLGTEELMYAPLRLAALLEERLRPSGVELRYQSTTRSPVAPIDRDGYAVRCALAFAAPDDPSRLSFVYNVRPGVADHIIVVTDGGSTMPMLQALRGCAPVTEVRLRDEVGTR